MGVNMMHDFMQPLGFGQKTGIDLEGEAAGILPSTEWKKKFFKKNFLS
jgi:penicillin-binding protein 2